MKHKLSGALLLLTLLLAWDLCSAASEVSRTGTGGAICNTNCTIYSPHIWGEIIQYPLDSKQPEVRVDSPEITDGWKAWPSAVTTNSYAQFGKLGGKVNISSKFTSYDAVTESWFIDSMIFSGPGKDAVVTFKDIFDGLISAQGRAYGVASFTYSVFLGDLDTGTELWFDQAGGRSTGGVVPVIYSNSQDLTVPIGKEITIYEHLVVRGSVAEPDQDYVFRPGEVEADFLNTAATQIIPQTPGVTGHSKSGYDYSSPMNAPEPGSLMLFGSALCFVWRFATPRVANKS